MSEEKEYNYSNLKDYLRYIRENLKPVKVPIAGLFISQNYFFFLNPLYKKYPEKKKYLDFFPVDLILAVQPSKHTFLAINWHALPIPTRQILLARLRKDYESAFDENKPRIRIPGMNYRKMLRYLKKIGVSVRKYRFERVRKMAVIPPDNIDEILKFKALTWYGTNYQGIKGQYINYKP